MLSQAADYREECNALYDLLHQVPAADWERATQFKGWTFNDVLGHLYLFDHAARLTIEDPSAFAAFLGELNAAVPRDESLTQYTRRWLGGALGPTLLSRWQACFEQVAGIYANAEPGQRLTWAGPPMSARTCISARQMETWAHGQALFDALGAAREEHDRIKNIVILGVNTFAWAFTNRGLEVPAPPPSVVLAAPSGALWSFNEGNAHDRLRGTAVDFCRVVTQSRNVADTELQIQGPIAARWMGIAQCFAGPPQPPPPPGTRFRQPRAVIP